MDHESADHVDLKGGHGRFTAPLEMVPPVSLPRVWPAALFLIAPATAFVSLFAIVWLLFWSVLAGMVIAGGLSAALAFSRGRRGWSLVSVIVITALMTFVWFWIELVVFVAIAGGEL